MEPILQDIYDGVVDGKSQYVMNKTLEALSAGIGARKIITTALNPAFIRLGDLMQVNEIYVTDVFMAARAMKAAMLVLEPFISISGVKTDVIVIGTVAGDLHDIGKNLVTMVLKGSGFNVIDLGIDVPKERFVEAVEKYNPSILALSALLTTTIEEMGNVISLLKEKNLRSKVKVMVGGAPVNRDFARDIGADVYTSNAFEAAEAARDLIKNHIGKFTII